MRKQTAMVWGADGGIGNALVRKLVEAGWDVAAVGRRIASYEGLTACALEADVTRENEVEQAVRAAAMEVEDVDLWVYAIGDIHLAPVAELSLDDWGRQLATNLTGAFLTTQASLPLLAPDAHLVYLGALVDRIRLPRFGAYAAAKAGLEAYAAIVAKEQRKRRVTVARPAAVDTPFWEKVPLRLPGGAVTADRVAELIIDAHKSGNAGSLDIV